MSSLSWIRPAGPSWGNGRQADFGWSASFEQNTGIWAVVDDLLVTIVQATPVSYAWCLCHHNGLCAVCRGLHATQASLLCHLDGGEASGTDGAPAPIGSEASGGLAAASCCHSRTDAHKMLAVVCMALKKHDK
jgi:hypothetical protein